jgi:CDP-diglyceride synthetase
MTLKHVHVFSSSPHLMCDLVAFLPLIKNNQFSSCFPPGSSSSPTSFSILLAMSLSCLSLILVQPALGLFLVTSHSTHCSMVRAGTRVCYLQGLIKNKAYRQVDVRVFFNTESLSTQQAQERTLYH